MQFPVPGEGAWSSSLLWASSTAHTGNPPSSLQEGSQSPVICGDCSVIPGPQALRKAHQVPRQASSSVAHTAMGLVPPQDKVQVVQDHQSAIAVGPGLPDSNPA